jgi:putative nucleotidyltransferase with HDIG domain
MTTAAWASAVARDLLKDALPRRWDHTEGVAARARILASMLGESAELVEVAAWLHDIGYSPRIAVTGFHPLDGARYLRDELGVDETLCRLVAHHSAAAIEAEERGIVSELAEFAIPEARLLNPLIYCDMTADPYGRPVAVEDRLSEILTRYPAGGVVHRSVTRSAPYLREATYGVLRRLSGESPA